MAGVLAPALSAECYDERNAEAVTVGYASHRRITDVNDYTPYQNDILRLYKWGIVGGVNEDGSYHPNDTLKRSELAALVVRMVAPSARLTLSWQSLSYRSAAGTTWGDLIAAPAEVSAAPAADDANAAARAALDKECEQAAAAMTATAKQHEAEWTAELVRRALAQEAAQ